MYASVKPVSMISGGSVTKRQSGARCPAAACADHSQFTYLSGSLAELAVGTSAIDVLEGTRAAFTSHQFKCNDVVGT